MSIRVGKAAKAPAFPIAAHKALENNQLRANVRRATTTIRNKRALRVEEMPDWESLRSAGAAIKQHTLAHLDHYLEEFVRNCERAGGKVHWARDADEANSIAINLIRTYTPKDSTAPVEVIKVKTMTSDEIQMNHALEREGIVPIETDLADMIVQLGKDEPSHIVVPALHKNRTEIRDIFRASMAQPELTDQPEDLTAAARKYLRERFLRTKIAVSGANFAIADTGSVCVVESEGNGRMCLTLPEVLITLVGIEKVIPSFGDLEVFLQTLPRSATGERMNPYNSLWTGVTPGDGPQHFHVILLDNGRTKLLEDEMERETLQCIRCAACLNACPVYRETGGHAYGSIYSGPIGAILSPQLQSLEHSRSLPYASTLCGACYEVCPVKINIPEVLIHLRGRVVREDQKTLKGKLGVENIAMQAAATIFRSERRYEASQRLARIGQLAFERKGLLTNLPGMAGGWTATRDLKPIPSHSFRDWWKSRNNTTWSPKSNMSQGGAN
ncbi:L-lactate dehydrogenase complex protein LldF [Bryocella elongata]|uniref:L-lactate dehydrogenase complex protein LldF n=1 Tax=Bryocella elongata TaxID=863522 RepID=A0A1H5T4M7_9BACT|nr:LutB/LldF family L-lactate oxidation iron-sulfur protein [Bryocella elongata]SEF56977.1 L-lactate dehydrogenase complex protein LldF [Bryocella elongata]